ncbi:MAG: response regulator [Terracidiphilus sp.]|jgi:DNA-binding response OmpR family regulator
MRILIIDDERAVADTLVMIMNAEGHQAEAVYDGGAALDKLASFAPECVISDVIFPGMNGIEICAKIQASLPECKIFLFSGQAETNDLIETARQAGHKWELLVKPLNPIELLGKVNSPGLLQSLISQPGPSRSGPLP